MRKKTTENGEPLFQKSEYLRPQRIRNYFSTMARHRKKGGAPGADDSDQEDDTLTNEVDGDLLDTAAEQFEHGTKPPDVAGDLFDKLVSDGKVFGDPAQCDDDSEEY